VILDVSKVQYFDTTFLRFLANLGRHAKKAQQANVKLLGVTPHLRRVLEITGLIRVFDAEFDLA
jgi:anti-anti-sigma factor